MLEWLREGWVLGWLGFSVSAVSAIHVLRKGKLERQKLELEIKRLRDSPEIVNDRRQIYERLRAVLLNVTRDVNPTLGDIRELHSIHHDGTFRFNHEISGGIQALTRQVIELHVGQQVADAMRNRVPDAEWHAIVEKEHAALTAVANYEERMAEIFKPYLSL